ncbi:MAG: helix-hairpin-helix domain-containing protein [Clostridia bacterium]|nr:helix-hairpin-helix domain-containing protein [Clostridia bacterium]
MVQKLKEAKFSVRLSWALVITGAVLITIVGLLLLYHDVGNEEKAAPASVYLPQATTTPEVVSTYSGEKLDLNVATKEALESLPGIGETLAQRIIDFREKTPFKVVRDLKKVAGIGEKTFAAICDYVYVTLPEEAQ